MVKDLQSEREANIFACLILMPSASLKEDMKNGIDLHDDKFLKMLSKKYAVPENAVLFRIMYYVEHGY